MTILDNTDLNSKQDLILILNKKDNYTAFLEVIATYNGDKNIAINTPVILKKDFFPNSYPLVLDMTISGSEIPKEEKNSSWDFGVFFQNSFDNTNTNTNTTITTKPTVRPTSNFIEKKIKTGDFIGKKEKFEFTNAKFNYNLDDKIKVRAFNPISNQITGSGFFEINEVEKTEMIDKIIAKMEETKTFTPEEKEVFIKQENKFLGKPLEINIRNSSSRLKIHTLDKPLELEIIYNKEHLDKYFLDLGIVPEIADIRKIKLEHFNEEKQEWEIITNVEYILVPQNVSEYKNLEGIKIISQLSNFSVFAIIYDDIENLISNLGKTILEVFGLTVKVTEGEVTIYRDEEEVDLDDLAIGDLIDFEANGTIIDFSEQIEIKAVENGELKITDSNPQNINYQQRSGKFFYKFHDTTQKLNYTVDIKNTVITIRGTELSVELTDNESVNIFLESGNIDIYNKNTDSFYQLEEQQNYNIDINGKITALDKNGQPIDTTKKYQFDELYLDEIVYDNDCLFSDVCDSSAWFYNYIKQAKEQVIVQGYSDGSFGINNNVTVAESLKMVLEKLTTDENFTSPDNNWWTAYWNYFENKLKTNLDNMPLEIEKVNSQMTRGNILAIILYLKGSSIDQLIETAGIFTDTTENTLINRYIEYAKRQGIVEGYSDGSFGINKNITRSELIKLIFSEE